nr:RNA-directed DNA polymerase, eukaryota [Tanacetum cinerariifolium]
WTPDFNIEEDDFSDSDVESLQAKNNDNFNKDDSDIEEVPEIIFKHGDQGESKYPVVKDQLNDGLEDAQSEDPFSLYKLLNKKRPNSDVAPQSVEEPKYPPGFTPLEKTTDHSNMENLQNSKDQIEEPNASKTVPVTKLNVNGDASVCSGHFQNVGTPKTGGFIIQLMEDLIKIGQTMGYKMDGCINNISEIVNIQGAQDPSVGNSGGILCVWDPNLFCKEHYTVSDYFIAVICKWVPNGKNFVIILVYAPNELSGRKMLLQYLNILIDSWKGEVIVMGDFNEVCSLDERFDRYLFDHRPILLREANLYYGPILFRFDHYWFEIYGFDSFVVDTWRVPLSSNLNPMLRLVTKLKHLKVRIHKWIKEKNVKSVIIKKGLKTKLADIDHSLDKGEVSFDSLEERMRIMSKLADLEKIDSIELAQKAKIKWSIEGDENSKYFHGIINKQRNNIAIRGILVDGAWIEEPRIVKNEFFNHFKDRPISLIGSLYKIIAKLLANRLVPVMGNLVNEVQSAFIDNRQVLDGPFILNEILQWCKAKKKKTMLFKVYFEKAFDSVRWDFLDDVLKKFGFGKRWCDWIQSSLRSSRGSILVNESPTSEFQFHKGLKQGDPLYLFLFILIMESLHLSFQNVVNAGMFKGINFENSLHLSHLFYADDVVFIGQWCDSNIKIIIRVLDCFFRASCLRINFLKSKIMGIDVDSLIVDLATADIGCMTLKSPFSYLGVKISGRMRCINCWEEIINKILSRLSKWKMKTLSIGGRLTLLKSVLGAMPIYYMSMFKVPKLVLKKIELKKIESIRSHFFKGLDLKDQKISLVKWENVLASKEKGGRGVSSFYALNRALIFKWIWRFHT